MNKRGISPYVATVLLVGFVVVIVTLIILWSRDVLIERAEKEGLLNEKRVECNSVSIDVESTYEGVKIINTGRVVIDGAVLREEGDYGVRVTEWFNPIPISEEANLPIGGDCSGADVGLETVFEGLCGNSDEVKITPALRPSGRGAPLVPCGDDKALKIRIS